MMLKIVEFTTILTTINLDKRNILYQNFPGCGHHDYLGNAVLRKYASLVKMEIGQNAHIPIQSKCKKTRKGLV